MFQNIGTVEILIIAAVLMVLFGAKKLPEFARGLGESGKELKKASRELKTALSEEEKDNS
jgi:TatA/E family protein of Tat protein translocase